MIINYMEIVVDNVMPKVIKKYDNICKCARCLKDIKAITLNNLKPMYVVSDQGYIYSKIRELETQFQVDIVHNVMKAIEIVNKYPRH